MFGIFIAFVLAFLVQATLFVPNLSFPPAATNPHTSTSYTTLGDAASVAGHMLYYQNQAVAICEESTCSSGFINGVLDPVGDTEANTSHGDYGYDYISVYNPANHYVATTFIGSGTETDLYGSVVSELINQTQGSIYVGEYNITSSNIQSKSGIINLPNSTYDQSGDVVFSAYQPVIAQPTAILH